jgi:catechol 2,3-dioxygenase-like lactoylglutathione lyase family enzyme
VLLDGIHHTAFLTADLDRLIGFYERVFDARVVFDRQDNRLRHALIEIGPHTTLHPFELSAADIPDRQPMFQRGRLDHFALNAESRESFLEIRRRLLAEGAHATEDGLVTDMGGGVWSISFHDPDGMWSEVMWMSPEASFADIGSPPDWEMIDPA